MFMCNRKEINPKLVSELIFASVPSGYVTKIGDQIWKYMGLDELEHGTKRMIEKDISLANGCFDDSIHALEGLAREEGFDPMSIFALLPFFSFDRLGFEFYWHDD